ncbi:COMM domain-containing protein 2 [Chrysoperla carnea]|uniref:COMM domain-containing protein 2 n=1 Tax=Chrysoperla carnea TaxID=189513 RepID=UPI001D0629F9|nr:COMM domain-containing protein 2 [Chrysoperla carnea]
MLITFKESHKQHLSLLISQSNQVFVDFCKLALDYLQNGPNEKRYTAAAGKLAVKTDDIQNAVEGIVNLLLQCCRNKLSIDDMRDSVLLLGFNEEKAVIFTRFYKSKRNDIHKTLAKFSVVSPHYQDLDWRFEVQVSSRSLLQQINPLIAMELTLQDKSDGFNFTKKSQDTTQKIVLQSDIQNIQHMTESLEQALSLVRTSQFKQLQRSCKQCISDTII